MYRTVAIETFRGFPVHGVAGQLDERSWEHGGLRRKLRRTPPTFLRDLFAHGDDLKFAIRMNGSSYRLRQDLQYEMELDAQALSVTEEFADCSHSKFRDIDLRSGMMSVSSPNHRQQTCRS